MQQQRFWGKIQLSGDFDSTSTATVPVIKSATSSIQGKIQLSGDLTGSSTSPTVTAGAITLAKMANLSGNSQIIGSSSTTSTPTNLTLGSGLQISGTVLSVNSATLAVPPATATTIGGIEMLGDLTGSVATAPNCCRWRYKHLQRWLTFLGILKLLVLVAQHLRLQISHWVPDYKFLEPC